MRPHVKTTPANAIAAAVAIAGSYVSARIDVISRSVASGCRSSAYSSIDRTEGSS